MSSKRKLVIYGNGAMASMLYYCMKDLYDIVGFCVDEICISNSMIESLPIVAFEDVDTIFPPNNHFMLIAVGFVQMNKIRKFKYNEAKAKGYSLVNYIHPSVSIYSNVELGDNVIILEFVSIHPGSKIGNNTFISSNVNIGHNCVIGDHCWINSGVSIAGGATIGNKCFLGINSSIGHKLKIAEKTFVGANVFINQNTNVEDTYLSAESTKFRMKSEKFLKFMNVL